MPYTVFITPELARVGITETQARTQGHNVAVAKVPVSAIPRAKSSCPSSRWSCTGSASRAPGRSCRLGGFVGGAVIGAFGYAAGAEIQSAEAIQGIKVAAGWVPAGLCIIAALVLMFYPLGAEQHRGIVVELHHRRATRALGEDRGLVAVHPVVTPNERYGAGASYVAERVAPRLEVP